MLNFKRIAILPAEPPNHLSTSISPQIQSQAWIMGWFGSAIRKGADAIYLRSYPWNGKEASDFIDSIRRHPFGKEIPILLPTDLFFEGPNLHLHLRDGENPIIDLNSRKFLVGRSCHDSEGVLKATNLQLDYVFLSPIFSTKTHPEASPLGIDFLRKTCVEHPETAIFALGGITPELERRCLKAGAWGIAAIRLFI